MNPIDLAAFWPGYAVVASRQHAENTLTLTLEPLASGLPRCGRCLESSPLIHDRRIRHVRDRDLFDQRVQLQVPVRRVDCLSCGRAPERIDWLEPASRLTQRLRAWVETLLPISHISRLAGLHWHTIKAIDKRRPQASVGDIDPGNVRRLVMNEFALHKGHRYATVIMDAERTSVLWAGKGNSRDAIRPFFELLGESCRQIEAVAMDMNTAFDLEVKQHCSHAEVVYDLFHVVARYGRDVIDRIRVDQANALSHHKPARNVVKQSRWQLLRNRDNLKDEQAVQLQELLAANLPLATVDVLKDALKEIWYAPSVREGWQRWRTWLRHARDSDLAPLQRFARNLRRYARGILDSARFHMHTSLLEGVNNRMAYGLWLQGLGLLLPENQGCLPRENAMNLFWGERQAWRVARKRNQFGCDGQLGNLEVKVHCACTVRPTPGHSLSEDQRNMPAKLIWEGATQIWPGPGVA